MTWLGRLLQAEIRKLMTTRSFPVLVVASAVLFVISVIANAAVAGKHGTAPLGTADDIDKLLSVASVTGPVALILGILVAGGEYRHRTIIPSLLVTPRRGQLIVAKAVALFLVGAIFGATVFGLAYIVAVIDLRAHDIHSLAGSPVSLFVGTVIATAMFGVLGVALGTLTRNTVAAIGLALAWVVIIEEGILHSLVPGLDKWLPTGAAIRLTSSPNHGDIAPILVAGLVLAAYAVILFVIADLTVSRMDVV
jgi:ABC-2 type transport system permease protein